ncbi:hypothetical protein Tco_0129065 [Tanacetum coccineum]
MHNLLPIILAQVGDQGSNQGDDRNQNGNAVNDNIQGNARNVIENNDRKGCTYKEFLAYNLKEYDGGRTGERTGRGGGRTRGRSGDLGNGGIDGQGGQVGSQGTEVNDGVDGVPDFSTIIAQQLQNLLPTILAQVGDHGRNLGNGRNQNNDAANDNIWGDVKNVIENNDHRGCTYKEFSFSNPGKQKD